MKPDKEFIMSDSITGTDNVIVKQTRTMPVKTIKTRRTKENEN